MKKRLSLLLIIALAFSVTVMFTACDQTTPGESTSTATVAPTAQTTEKPTEATTPSETTEVTEEETEAPEQVSAPDTLTVGTTELNGDFIYGFGNSAYDAYVKDLLGGSIYYGLVRPDAGGALIINPVVVKEVETEEDAEGNKTYTFEIYDDLKWSDGSAITADDYVFSALWGSSPEWLNAGATTETGEGLVGYPEFYAGDTDTFKGVQKLGDYELSLTIAAENLPYFFETSYVGMSPLCMAVYAPGASIESDENGARIEGVDLQEACNTVAQTERHAPTVTCGPYKFVSFANQTVTLEVNEYFKGDMDGTKPAFKNVVVKAVPSDTDVDQVIAGEIDMTTGVIAGAKIESAKASTTADLHSYLRNGFGYLAFHCDWGPTADENVRWGIASLIDRNEVIDYVLGGYGGLVDGDYGFAQWMYQEKKADIGEQLKPISYNIDLANQYFDQSEWIYESDGETAFDATKANADGTYLRHNSDGEALVIEHSGSENNPVTDAIELCLKAAAPLAGMQFNMTRLDFSTMYTALAYPFDLAEGERFYNTFNLALTYSAVFDPYYSHHSDYFGTWVNICQVDDPELDSIIEEMRNIDPMDTEEYADKWLEYQVAFNEYLPLVPLYSNQYFDIYNTGKVKSIESTPFLNWAQSVCRIVPAA